VDLKNIQHLLYIHCNPSNTEEDIVFTKLNSHSIISTYICGKTNMLSHCEILKGPYEFLKMTFHVVCNIVPSE